MKANLLRCRIAQGQFSGEYAVKATEAGGQDFSLFCPEEYLVFDNDPIGAESVDGWMVVDVIETRKGLALVRLRRPILGNGPYATVHVEQIEQRTMRETA